MSTIQKVRDLGPTILIPLAWIFRGLSIFGMIGLHNMFIAHLVMLFFLTFFLSTGWSEMDGGVLETWRLVMVLGVIVTSLGVVGFINEQNILLIASLLGWMFIPSIGLFDTGRRKKSGKSYVLLGILSTIAIFLMGYFVFIKPAVVVGMTSLLMVAISQSASILFATMENS